MLKTLKVWNFALLEQVEIEFTSGLNILTGETGAGKSILIDALGAILGHRLSTDMIRTGCEWLRIEAVFSFKSEAYLHEFLQKAEIIDEGEDELIITRQLTNKGKNSLMINGCRVTASVLKGLGELLVDIHGQNENLALLKQENQFALLDNSEAEIGDYKEKYLTVYQLWQDLQKELSEKEEQRRKSAEREDVLRWQQQEIELLQLNPGEDEKLEKEIKCLSNAEKIMENLQHAKAMFYGEGEAEGIFGELGMVTRCLENLERYEAKLPDLQNTVEEAVIQLRDVAEALSDYQDNADFDEANLDKMQERLNQIDKLKRKYGPSIENILSYLEKITLELGELENYDSDRAELQKHIQECHKSMIEAADKLTIARKKAAEKLSALIGEQIRALGMPDAGFVIDLTATDYTANGADAIELLFSANAGEKERPLGKVASGGELSRIALGIKAIEAVHDSVVDSMVFDEIDTGIGGRTAQMVAERIAQVACHKQVLCITHLPQIACMADNHLYICKKTQNGVTATEVYSLQDGERTGEIARMASGNDVTAASLDNAREMIAYATEKKVKFAQKMLCN